MRCGILKNSMRAAACLIIILSMGCVSTTAEKQPEPAVQQLPLFPPQSVMRSGNYAAFLAENEIILKTCADPEKCALALFNICFLYSYSKSPYYNPARGQLYFEDLVKGSPESPWAYQARVWVDIMKKSARKEVKKRTARDDKSKESGEDPKSKDSVEDLKRELAAIEAIRQIEAAQEGPVPESDRRQLEDEIRTKDETIKELTRQLERSRQIDIEIEKKQRRLSN